MKSVIVTDVVKTDNIKGYFHLYYWQSGGCRNEYKLLPHIAVVYGNGGLPKKYAPILRNKFNYILNEQRKKIEKHKVGGEQVMDFINEKIQSNELPERFKPTIKEMKHAFRSSIRVSRRLKRVEKEKGFPLKGFHWKSFPAKQVKFPFGRQDNLNFYRVEFRESITSLIEQKFKCDLSKNIVCLFKSLNERDGIEFDDFIDNWVKKLSEEAM